MLSLVKGVPIAKIVDSNTFKVKNGMSKYLGLVNQEDIGDNDVPGYKVDPYQLISEDELEIQAGSKKTKQTKMRMKQLIKEKKFNDKLGKEFILNDGMLEPVPNINKDRDVLYVSGPSGSGKSTFIASFLKNYCDMNPDNPIYMFSAVKEDPAFEMFEQNGPMSTRDRLVRIVLDKEYLDDIEAGNGVEIDDLDNSAVVFDDVDVISNRKIKQHVIDLRSQCLEIGRHNKITTCCTTHQLCNYKDTKILIQEADKVVVFPRSGSTYHIKRFLKEYCGMKQCAIDKVIHLPSRWVMICKTYPQHIIYKDGAYLITED